MEEIKPPGRLLRLFDRRVPLIGGYDFAAERNECAVWVAVALGRQSRLLDCRMPAGHARHAGQWSERAGGIEMLLPIRLLGLIEGRMPGGNLQANRSPRIRGSRLPTARSRPLAWLPCTTACGGRSVSRQSNWRGRRAFRPTSIRWPTGRSAAERGSRFVDRGARRSAPPL